MAIINPPLRISSGGASTWDLKVEAGRNYTLTCKPSPSTGGYSGSTLSLSFEDQSDSSVAADSRAFLPIDDSTMDGTTMTGKTLRAPSGTIRITSSGSIASVAVHLTPLFDPTSR